MEFIRVVREYQGMIGIAQTSGPTLCRPRAPIAELDAKEGSVLYEIPQSEIMVSVHTEFVTWMILDVS